MKHEGLGPIPVGTMVVIIGLQLNNNAVGTVVEGEAYRTVLGPNGKHVELLCYKVEVPRDIKLTPEQLAKCGGRYLKRTIGAKRKHLIPIQDPGDTEETFRESDAPRRRSRTRT